MRGRGGGGVEVKVHGNCLLLVNSDVVGDGPGEEVSEGGLEWLVVSPGDVDGCCECGIFDVLPPVRGIMQSDVDEDQETERPDLGLLGHAERKRKEGGRGAQRGNPRVTTLPSEPHRCGLVNDNVVVYQIVRVAQGQRTLLPQMLFI